MLENDVLRSVLSSEYTLYGAQSVYSDCCGVYNPGNILNGQFLSSQEFVSQQYLNLFDNSYKMGQILATGRFMSSLQNMLSLFRIEYKEETDSNKILKLPKTRKIKISFDEMIKNRVSSRVMTGKKISLQDLSDILNYSFGVVGKNEEKIFGVETDRYRRPFPSGGGMYSSKLYVCAYHVDEIDEYIYEYQPVSNTLRKHMEIKSLDNFIVTERYNALTGQYKKIENFDPSVLLFIVNDFRKQRMKYGELSLLLALCDCGSICQNISLLTSALHLNSCVWAGFKKADTEQVLNIDGIDNHCLMTILIGR